MTSSCPQCLLSPWLCPHPSEFLDFSAHSLRNILFAQHLLQKPFSSALLDFQCFHHGPVKSRIVKIRTDMVNYSKRTLLAGLGPIKSKWNDSYVFLHFQVKWKEYLFYACVAPSFFYFDVSWGSVTTERIPDLKEKKQFVAELWVIPLVNYLHWLEALCEGKISPLVSLGSWCTEAGKDGNWSPSGLLGKNLWLSFEGKYVL